MDDIFFDKVEQKIGNLENELREYHRNMQGTLQTLISANAREYREQLWQLRQLRSWMRGLRLEVELIRGREIVSTTQPEGGCQE